MTQLAARATSRRRRQRFEGHWIGVEDLGPQEIEDRTAPTKPTAEVSISADVFGNAIAVWSQHDGVRYNVAANRYAADAGRWGDAGLIETNDVSVYSPTSAKGPERTEAGLALELVLGSVSWLGIPAAGVFTAVKLETCGRAGFAGDTVTGLADGTWYFSVAAFDYSGNVSVLAAEASKTIP